MENETCAFETWLTELQTKIAHRRNAEVFSIIAQEIGKRYGIKVWFAEILGKRWSYLGGEGHEFPSPSLASIPLTAHYGVIVENQINIPPEENTRLLAFLKECFQKLDTRNS